MLHFVVRNVGFIAFFINIEYRNFGLKALMLRAERSDATDASGQIPRGALDAREC